MKRAAFSALFAFALATGVAAQDQQQQPSTQGAASGRQQAGTMTLTGCIRQSGTGADRTFTLAVNQGAGGAGNATGGGSSTGGSTSTRPGDTSTSGRAGDATAGGRTGDSTGAPAGAGQANRGTSGTRMYTLEGSDVAKYAGQQVEVTGTLSSSAAGGAATSGGAGRDSSSAAGAGRDSSSSVGTTGSANQTLRVTSVRMISSTCSQ